MTKKIYKLGGSERIFYAQADIEAESLERAKEIYERMIADGEVEIEDNEDFRLEVIENTTLK